jgi:hypothetical protein
MDSPHGKIWIFFHLVHMMSLLVWIGWKHVKLSLIDTRRPFDYIDGDGNLWTIRDILKVVSMSL